MTGVCESINPQKERAQLHILTPVVRSATLRSPPWGCQLAGMLAVYLPMQILPIVGGSATGSAVDETHPEECLLTGSPRWLRGHGYCAIPPSPIENNQLKPTSP